MEIPTTNLINRQNSITQGEIYCYCYYSGVTDSGYTWRCSNSTFILSDTTTKNNNRYLPYLHWRLNDIYNDDNKWVNSGKQGGIAQSGGTIAPYTGITGKLYYCTKWDDDTNALEYTPETRSFADFGNLTISFWVKCNYGTNVNLFILKDEEDRNKFSIDYRTGTGIVVTGDNEIIAPDITIPDDNITSNEWSFFGLTIFDNKDYIIVYDRYNSGGTFSTINFNFINTDTLYLGAN